MGTPTPFRGLRSRMERTVSHRMPLRHDVPPLCERCHGTDCTGHNSVCPGPYSPAEQRRILKLLGVKSCLELGCGASAHKEIA